MTEEKGTQREREKNVNVKRPNDTNARCNNIKGDLVSLEHVLPLHCMYVSFGQLSMKFNGVFFRRSAIAIRKICHVPLGEQNTPMAFFFVLFEHL